MKNKIINGLAIVAGLFVNPVFADDATDSFFGMSIERAFIDVAGFEDEGIPFKIALGHQFSDFVGFEILYRDYGQLTDSEQLQVPDGAGGTITLNGEQKVTRKEITLYVIGYLPVTTAINLFAKAGYSGYNERTRFEFTGFPNQSAEVNDNNTFYGLGAKFNMDEDSAVRLEYEAPDEGDSYIISFGFMHLF
ncbi:MAG: hypothetical protein PVF34_05040 [Gammaproteobacteria bacterium]|jgi:hypothetical protein